MCCAAGVVCAEHFCEAHRNGLFGVEWDGGLCCFFAQFFDCLAVFPVCGAFWDLFGEDAGDCAAEECGPECGCDDEGGPVVAWCECVYRVFAEWQ